MSASFCILLIVSVLDARTLKRSLDLFDSVSFDYVTHLDVVVALDIQTAVHTHMNFLDIVLESLEGSKLSGVNNDTVTDHAHLRVSLELTLADNTSCDSTHLGNLEGLLNFGCS